MTNRRSFFATAAALGMSLFAPVGRLFGYCRGARLIINGVELALPETIDIRIELDRPNVFLGPLRLTVSGGRMCFINDSDRGAGIEIRTENLGGIVAWGRWAGMFFNNFNDPHVNQPPAFTFLAPPSPKPSDDDKFGGPMMLIGGFSMTAKD